jgi:hypothetical protein
MERGHSIFRSKWAQLGILEWEGPHVGGVRPGEPNFHLTRNDLGAYWSDT